MEAEKRQVLAVDNSGDVHCEIFERDKQKDVKTIDGLISANKRAIRELSRDLEINLNDEL